MEARPNAAPDGAATRPRIVVVVPCYRVRRFVLDVLARIGPECTRIFVVDDACPEQSGDHVAACCPDPRVRVLRHTKNEGVGGAMRTGYRAALAEGADVVVKLDGDGQMDPRLLPALVAPILSGSADFTKGNRFVRLADARAMPWVRLVGNAGLSFLSKLSSGYWDVFDPTNGLTAVHADVLAEVPLDELSRGYFFESDLLHHLGFVRAVVLDVPMRAVYGQESSGLSPLGALFSFSWGHARNTVRRLFYTYFVRDFSVASLQLPLGIGLGSFGTIFGALEWREAVARGVGAYAGTVMLAALPVILGVQFLLAFLAYDVARVPRIPIHPLLRAEREARARLATPTVADGGPPA
jgi:glycosyltransferase involved in cell wall biosynthesis